MAGIKYYCSMDVGGTSARVKFESVDGELLGEFTGRGCTLNVEGNEISEERYRILVTKALDALCLEPTDCEGICIAASGIDSEQNEIDCRGFFINMGFCPENIRVCNDCEVYLLASDEPDIIVVSGTGSIAIGKKSDGSLVRCGGLGHIISDEGSAYDLALRIFRAVGNHLDGRFYCPVLADLLLTQTGLKTATDLNIYLTENANERTKAACYANLAGEAANQGDEGAKQVLDECSQSLYKLVLDTIKKAELPKDKKITVWLWGSVISSPDSEMGRLLTEKLSANGNINAAVTPFSALDAAMLAAKNIKAK